jgi:electron transport complex protein RnfG
MAYQAALWRLPRKRFFLQVSTRAVTVLGTFWRKAPELRHRLDYQASLLAGFALLTTLLLGLGDLATRHAIEARLDEDMASSLRQVLPREIYDNDPLRDTVTIPDTSGDTGQAETRIHIARKEGRMSAVAFKTVAPDGYAGPITLIVGIERNGTLLGVRVIAHTETPGLGDKIELGKSNWILSFVGKSRDKPGAARFKVKKDGGDFDQFAGATITPRKVVKAVWNALGFFERHKAEWLRIGEVAHGSGGPAGAVER